MNAEVVLSHFDRIADATDAINRLRQFVLDLAIRGKLVPQDPQEQPAPELLKRTEGTKTDQSDLPLHWVRAKVGTLLNFQYGKGLPPSDRGSNGAVPVFGSNGIVGFTNEALTTQPSIIVGRKGSAGALNICNGPSWTTDVAYFVEPPSFVAIRFLFLALKTAGLDKLGKGVKPGLSRSDAYEQFLHIPPLAEQHRIVAKVDELMALCDRLEAERKEREERRDRLVTASLHRLTLPTEPTTAEAARANARFVLDHLGHLTTRVEHIKLLRQTILDLAVRGKLVPQDPADEPASELLKRIKYERNQLLKAGYPNRDEARAQVKKQAEQSVPDDLEILPVGWSWATLLQCSVLVIDCKNKTAPYVNKGIKLIRTTNVRDGEMKSKDQKYVDQKTYENWSARCTPEPGDILITREAPMGEVCLIPPEEQICLGQRMMLARLVPNKIDPDFMIYSLRDPKLMERVQDKPIGATVQHLRVGGVETLLVPLPPLAEQRRIVSKLNELMALCDLLEVGVEAVDLTRSRLLESVLHEALQHEALAEAA